MQNVEYVYTLGMDESEVETYLSRAETGVLSLARDGEAYGVPVHVHYDGEDVFVRLGEHEGSEKLAFLESTTSASLVVYDAGAAESWSVLLRGDLVREGEASATAINERFGPMRIFGETVQDLDAALYRFDAERVTGRRTPLDDATEVVDPEA
ncbi:pyridoxamine 5'-phosphate oxidase family protein [Halorubellus sp. PRR65]|uniref:pyridoxamine 5'-phosphate oxidase family protein n=1 Tax=Halorubellus sp. PRR65 TaxID=3098148 RepID=UPI002B25EB02|nr:pyridoxamine 5'-phosphate oxidase family protein [Halorubellus sp. PRR65]